MAASLKTVIWLSIAAATLLRTTLAAVTVNSTLLILARDAASAPSGTNVLQGYGIPYQVVDLSSGGAALPQLNATADAGNFGGIVAVSARGYANGDDWGTALSEKQWRDIYAYQEAFGVRLVRLNAWPGEKEYGVQSVGGVVTANQPVAVTDSKEFAGANIVECVS